jgi:hypothetical protein
LMLDLGGMHRPRDIAEHPALMAAE